MVPPLLPEVTAMKAIFLAPLAALGLAITPAAAATTPQQHAAVKVQQTQAKAEKKERKIAVRSSRQRHRVAMKAARKEHRIERHAARKS
ncbi:hypothetical protein GCM10022281_11770 [Sphingomonas rosea]|uniref:Uncharacterized protein n=2 Tax=Sphingomonas rosea TaxID=335605 RepID=A0ABP7TZN5_9SPHN